MRVLDLSFSVVALLATAANVQSFAPSASIVRTALTRSQQSAVLFDTDKSDNEISPTAMPAPSREGNMVNALASFALVPLILAAPVDAAEIANTAALPSALAAYGHYLGLVLVTMSLAAERLLVKPDMSADDELKLVIADSVYGIAGVLVLVSGYFRVTEYGKGWDFYSHEPIFWVKMFLFAVMGSSSFFPTIKIIQRAVQSKNASDGKGEPPEPLSEKLAARMIKVINGELLVCSCAILPYHHISSVVCVSFGPAPT